MLVDGKRVIAFGNAARPVELSARGSWQIAVPFTSSVIQDEEHTRDYVRWLLSDTMGKVWIFRPQITVVLPGPVSPFQCELWLHVLATVGASSVVFLHPFLAVLPEVMGTVADEDVHAVALWQADQLQLGVVTRGHVQAEWSGTVRTGRESVAVWRQWLQRLATETRQMIEQQGILLITDRTEAKTLALTQLWDVPVVVIPPEKVVIGAKKMGQKISL
jgi:hypothetical protein